MVRTKTTTVQPLQNGMSTRSVLAEMAKRIAAEREAEACNLPPTNKSFKKLANCVANLMPGTYYIGDPCYPLGRSWIYAKEWDATGYNTPTYFTSDQGVVFIDQTFAGDGSYHDTKSCALPEKMEFMVDSGTISIISIGLIHQEVERQKLQNEKDPATFEQLVKGGHIHTFTSGVNIHFGNGLFRFKDLASGDDIIQINSADDSGCTCTPN